MIISKLHAKNVHGYLPLDIEFFDEITFLTGLNGSGKTSALRLLMALLTPNIEELGAISYTHVTATVVDNGKTTEVSADRTLDGVVVRISNSSEQLQISSAELELIQEAKRREGPRSPIVEKYLANPTYQAIKDMSTPMFLGLDRRFFIPGNLLEDSDDMRRREYLARRYWPEDPSFRNTTVAAGLIDVNYLVVTRMQEIRAKQEELDERLRANFFTKAFEYKPSAFLGKAIRLPSKTELNRYQKQLTKIERASEGVKIPVPEIQVALTKFFEKMRHVVESLNKSSEELKGRRAGKKTSEKPQKEQVVFDKDYVEWIVNKPQADRIVEHLRTLEEYIEERNALRDPINRFLTLVNGFFAQTKKKVAVASNGQLNVSIDGNETPNSISALSSGERQLLVMLAHLSLNPSLVGSGVFIVDEPELSLHIDWQEKFVEAIREANPKVQLILATHSPAIILDRVDVAFSLT
jgi:predicted ATPase